MSARIELYRFLATNSKLGNDHVAIVAVHDLLDALDLVASLTAKCVGIRRTPSYSLCVISIRSTQLLCAHSQTKSSILVPSKASLMSSIRSFTSRKSLWFFPGRSAACVKLGGDVADTAFVVKRVRQMSFRFRHPEWRNELVFRLGFPIVGAAAAVAFAWLINQV